MGLLSRAGDLVYTFRFLRLLTTSFEDTTAYKLGVIDNNGKRIKKAETAEEKSAYNAFHRLVFNIKKLLSNAPGGSSKLASYAAALFLLKEKFGVDNIDKILKESGIDPLDMLQEQTSWFVLDNKQLSPGIYRIMENKVLNESCEELVRKYDKVRIIDNSFPVGDIFGIDIYEAIHMRTNKPIYVAVAELGK